MIRVLIYHSIKPLGKTIQIIESNNWNHASIELPTKGLVYEMLGNGITKRTLDESLEDSTSVIGAYVEVDEEMAYEILEGWLKNKYKYFFRGIAKQLVYQVTGMLFGKPLWIGKNYIEKRFICSTMVARLLNLLLAWYKEWWTKAPEDFANSVTSEGVAFGIEEYNWHKVK